MHKYMRQRAVAGSSMPYDPQARSSSSHEGFVSVRRGHWLGCEDLEADCFCVRAVGRREQEERGTL